MKLNRWIYTTIGIFALMFAGLVYAWSVFAISFKAYFTSWTTAQLSLTFTICMIVYCIAGLICGWSKLNGQIKMLIAGLLFFIGFYLVSRTTSLITLYIGYGVFAASASGIAFNTVMSTITSYFPDKPGVISGVLLMGFGFGSFFIGKIYQAVTPTGDGFRNTFFGFGVILLLVMVICSFFMRRIPNDSEISQYESNIDNNRNKNFSHIDVKPVNVLKNHSFQIYFIWATVLSMAGLILISQAGAIGSEVSPKISAASLATAVGLISIFNGIGRVLTGVLFDKIGRFKTMLVINTCFLIAISLIFVAMMQHHYIVLIISYIMFGLAYGGIVPTNSAFVKKDFGTKYYAVNMSLTNMNLIVSSLGSTVSGLLYDKTSSYYSTLILILGLILISYLASIFSRSKSTASMTEHQLMKQLSSDR